MTDSDGALPEPWQSALDELNLEGRSVDAPDGEGAADFDWFELYSKFATNGFVRALVGDGAEQTALRLQFALPDRGTGEELPTAVRDEFADLLGGDWRVVSEDPEWEFGATLEEGPDEETAGRCLQRLVDLADVADSGSLSDADWLTDRVGGVSSDESTRSTAPPPDSSSPPVGGKTQGAGGRVFESIGDGSSSEAPSAALESVGIDNWELLETDGGVEARIRLDAALPPTDVDRIGRELTHSLRSRYDIAARPLPTDGPASPGGTELKFRANPAKSGLDGPETAEQVRSDLEKYLERLVRFDDLGVNIASVLGLDSVEDASSARSKRTGSATRGKRGRGRREESNSRRNSGSATGDAAEEPPAERPGGQERESADRGRSGGGRRDTSIDAESDVDDSEKVVLDIGGGDRSKPPDPVSDTKPESGLEPGNYRDPRLMREDATTSLVDIVLRHPGYAEEKMGHNLSILLDINFPDAMDLVQQAPSIIAWGVGRERALEFKQFIENSGGKVVLVEPDSLKD